MTVDSAEKLVRRAGAFGALVTAIAVYSGLMRGLRHPKGRITGEAPAAAQAFARGSLALFIPVTIASLGTLYLLWRPIKVRLPGPGRVAALVVGSLLYFPGLALMLWGRLTLGEMHNVSTSAAAQLYADHRLITSGPYRFVRHPMYVGGIMAELGALLLYRTWATLLLALNIPNLLLRARREEEVLAAEFGGQWEKYARQVPGWIPRIPS